ncbi:hypothetical protein ES703_52565 [subsurface metagenome]
MADKPKRSHKKKVKPWNALRVAERQEYFFLVYEQMGVSRTLKRLWGLVRGVGVELSLKTLERYSSQYNWQSRILERAARHESADFLEIQAQVEQMTSEHVRTFQDIGALVAAGIKHWQGEIEKKVKAGFQPTLEMDFVTIGKLAQTYQYGERLARGLATSKAEVIIEVLPPLVKDMFAVFLAVNVITNDPPEMVRKREAEFISRGDQVLLLYYGKTKELPEGRGKNE